MVCTIPVHRNYQKLEDIAEATEVEEDELTPFNEDEQG